MARDRRRTAGADLKRGTLAAGTLSWLLYWLSQQPAAAVLPIPPHTLVSGSIGAGGLAVGIGLIGLARMARRRNRRGPPVPFAWKIFKTKSTLVKEREGWVYILTNPAMPGLCKVGYTDIDPDRRARQLSTTGVAASFIVEWAVNSRWAQQIEQQAHRLMADRRTARNREFFKGTPDQIRGVVLQAQSQVMQMAVERGDITP